MDDTTLGTLTADTNAAVDTTTTQTPDFGSDNIFGEDKVTFGDTEPTVETTESTSDKVTLSDGTQVTLDELERGYLRQSDYTKKTQDLSRQRQELAQAEQLLHALETDPQATLEALQRHLGIQNEPSLEELDPIELELREHRAFIEEQRSMRMQQEIESELAGLSQKYGEFDWGTVLEFAIDQEIPDLEAALLLYNKRTETDQARREANERALAAKRGAPPVAGGSRAQGTVAAPTQMVESVMDAWAAAKQELGYE